MTFGLGVDYLSIYRLKDPTGSAYYDASENAWVVRDIQKLETKNVVNVFYKGNVEKNGEYLSSVLHLDNIQAMDSIGINIELDAFKAVEFIKANIHKVSGLQVGTYSITEIALMPDNNGNPIIKLSDPKYGDHHAGFTKYFACNMSPIVQAVCGGI